MTQEEKSILLQDLCARLPYGVKVYDYDREETREMGLGTLHDIMFNDLECKPYLRSMLSMTEEEKQEYIDLLTITDTSVQDIYIKVFDWYHIHHFDYRRLIEKGLALEALEGMYKEWISIRGNLKEDKEGNIVGGLKL